MRERRPHRPILLLAVLLLALASACAPARAGTTTGTTTVLVVRHAERASESERDPPLSAAGEARALALAGSLADAGVEAIYATEYQRTRNTARPLAERLGLPVGTQPPGDPEASAAALAREILESHRGRTVLVVGHSNTVPVIVRALGGADVGALGSGDYDHLFVVQIRPDGRVGTLRTRFGAPARDSHN